MTHVGIGGSHRQTMQDMLHVGIILIDSVVNAQDAFVILVTARLIKDAQHHVQTVVDMSVQTGNLYDDAVMCQAVDERIRQSPRHDVTVVV